MISIHSKILKISKNTSTNLQMQEYVSSSSSGVSGVKISPPQTIQYSLFSGNPQNFTIHLHVFDPSKPWVRLFHVWNPNLRIFSPPGHSFFLAFARTIQSTQSRIVGDHVGFTIGRLHLLQNSLGEWFGLARLGWCFEPTHLFETYESNGIISLG